MVKRNVAQVFSPGEYIQEELEARGWTQSDLAEIMGRDATLISSIVTGRRAITPETARGLAAAFGTSAELWTNLESTYRLAQVEADDGSVERRANLYLRAPIQIMMRRGWLRPCESVDGLEAEYKRFFEVATVDESPHMPHAARKSSSSSYAAATKEELAWLFRARHLARALDTGATFSTASLNTALDRLRALTPNPEEVRKIPAVLREGGIRFLIVENLRTGPKLLTKIDGSCFWLDKKSPVIALSLRFDRIDWLWHTLLHELTHIKYREGRDTPILDTEIDKAQADEARPDSEKRADREAAAWLVDQSKLNDFIARIKPFYSKLKIRRFAARLGVHPGVVVGQLQNRREISYAHNREMLVPVKDIITRAAVTDGWGECPQVAV